MRLIVVLKAIFMITMVSFLVFTCFQSPSVSTDDVIVEKGGDYNLNEINSTTTIEVTDTKNTFTYTKTVSETTKEWGDDPIGYLFTENLGAVLGFFALVIAGIALMRVNDRRKR